MTGFIERSSSLFVCKCGNRTTFAVGMNVHTLKLDVLLCTACKTAYALEYEDEDELAGVPTAESAKALH